MFFALLLAAAAGEAAPSPAAPPAPGGPLTLQQRFDEASALVASGDCGDAVPKFEALEHDPAYRAGSLPAAMIAVLKGECLVKLSRGDEGEMAILQGLPRLRQSGERFRVDIATALLSLGDAALNRGDYAGARQRYEEARAMPDATDPATINSKLARATAFDGGPEPLAYAAEAIRLIEAMPGISRSKLAEAHTVHARILLNQGQNRAAYTEMQEVLRLTGGLDLRVTLPEVVMRSDLALAAKLVGDDGNARKYLAYTGAGRITDSPFSKALNMDSPTCGAETGLRPDDFAVVDFAIGQDGRVINANTVYTRGSASVAGAFAQAVKQWVWAPEAIKDIKPFFLYATRVEVRCSTAGQDTPGLMQPMEARFMQWAQRTLDLAASPDPDMIARALGAIGPDAPPARQVARDGLRVLTEPMGTLAKDGLLTQALQLAAADGIPAQTRNFLRIAQLNLRSGKRGTSHLPEPVAFSTLIALPEITADPIALDTLRLLGATGRNSVRAPGTDSDALLRQIVSDPQLPDQHPLRQAALLKLADAAAKRRDYATAEANFRATGLSGEQCALLGLRPAMQWAHGTFPDEAARWGFEGWVVVELDVGNDGKTSAVRPLIAYPPFVFNTAATRTFETARFESSYRPGANQACSAERLTVSFSIR